MYEVKNIIHQFFEWLEKIILTAEQKIITNLYKNIVIRIQ